MSIAIAYLHRRGRCDSTTAKTMALPGTPTAARATAWTWPPGTTTTTS